MERELQRAAKHGDYDQLTRLLSDAKHQGTEIDINAGNPERAGCTPLHYGVYTD